MALGDTHQLATNLVLIEGHHPHRMWEDPDIPSIALYRAGSTLYLLDTGVGPVQRQSILDAASDLGPVDEVVVLNSHGHIDHLGNNDVVDDIAAATRGHYLSLATRPALDPASFFGAMYRRGVPYFDYLDGLELDVDSMTSLLRAVGADAALEPSEVAAPGALLKSSGIAPAASRFIPSMVVDMLLTTYPATNPRVGSLRDYEDLGPAKDISIGQTAWTGWSFGHGAVQVLQVAGHSAGGCVFYVPEHSFLMLADETTTIPIWADSIPANVVRLAERALVMMDSGHLDQFAAGHRPMLPLQGAEARATLNGLIAGSAEFSSAVSQALSRHDDGSCIDELYAELTAAAAPGSMVDMLRQLQFPVYATFLKLTLLNHCLLLDLPQGTDGAGRRTFRAG